MKTQKIKINFVLLISFISINYSFSQPKEMYNDYKITFDYQNPLQASIKATISLKTDTIQMHKHGASSEKEGWASFAKIMTIKNTSGEILKIQKISKLKWLIKGTHNGIIDISYQVKFPYAEPSHKWSGVIRSTAGYYDGNGLFLFARSLFIYNSEFIKTKVSFQLPNAWKVSAPWIRTNKNEFYSNTLEDLMENALVIGDHNENIIKNGGFRSNLIFLGYKGEANKIVKPVFNKIIQNSLDFFNHTGKSEFLMIWFPDGNWQTGEAFHDSYVVIKPELPNLNDRPDWANSIAHETFHYWNGTRFKSAENQSTQWFSEGFTDYIANLNLIRNGIITERQFLNLMQKHFILYTSFRFKWGTPYKRYSLVEAGFHKSTYNPAVYDGGWTASFCLDVLIREATSNKKGLEDVFIELYNQFQQDQIGYTNNTLLSACNKISGLDLSFFFKKYIFGKEMIPIVTYLRKAGFEGSTTVYSTHVNINPVPTDLQLSIRQGILTEN